MRPSASRTQDQSLAHPAPTNPPAPRPTTKAFVTTPMRMLDKPSTESAPQAEHLPYHNPKSAVPRDESEVEMDLLHGKKRFDIDFINVNPSSDNLEGESKVEVVGHNTINADYM